MAASLTKEEVNYRPGSRAEHCGNCSMIYSVFGTWRCELVKGGINPRYVCDEWEPANDSKRNAEEVEGNTSG